MDGMILAAGFGTRLRPLTDSIPKALIPLGERPALEVVARRLVNAGVDRLIVNVHYHADQVQDELETKQWYGAEGYLSIEDPEILDTGGGLVAAEPGFRHAEPFFLHNVDVVSDVDLKAMYRDARQSASIATLAVMDRPSSRHLLFDDVGLCGYRSRETDHDEFVRRIHGTVRTFGFCGIHVIDPALFSMITEQGAFSIITLYLRLAAEGVPISPWDATGATWFDIGTHEKLARAREYLRANDI